MAERRVLEHGELTAIIIGAVVNSGAKGIRARQLADKLVEWGIATTTHRVAMMLVSLARSGRIERVRAGVYKAY